MKSELKNTIKSQNLSFDYLVSSSYEVHGKGKASNFIIKPSFQLLEKNISGLLENQLFQIALNASKNFDHKFLNTQKSDDNKNFIFNKDCVNIEDIAKAYFDQLKKTLKETFVNEEKVNLFSVQVQRGFVDRANYYHDKTIDLSTASRFSSVHKHYNLDLSKEENKTLYEKCSVDHGHEYEIRIFLKKTLTSHSDYKVFDLPQLKIILKQNIIEALHGKYLNDIVGNTSGEILVKHCYNKLKSFFPDVELGIELQETRKNSFFYPVNFL